jgi:hypothetical protein
MAMRHTCGIAAHVLVLCWCIALPDPGTAQTCGNGIAEPPEECDDGNLVSGDGCSSSCQLENASARCAGVPASAGTALDVVRIASGLSSPTHITAPPLDPNRLFVAEKTGAIRIIKNGVLLATPFLDLSGRVGTGTEQGLLSVAFHPNYKTNRRLFVDYTDTAGNTVVARYEASATDPDVVDPSSARGLLLIGQPFPNDNGGQLAFGPDGYLYVGMGDGGGVGDPQDSAQSDSTPLGKLLRLDVDVETPPFYAVPPSNPHPTAGPMLGLVWAKGLRNPWRFSFDRLTGDLYIGDVGEDQREEVDFTPASSTGGENYGWDIFEGSLCFDPLPFFPTCPSPTAYVFPVYEYDHSQGCAVTGGFAYRGCALPDLRGTYFFSDYCTAFVRTFEVVGGIAQNLVDRTADVAPGGGLSIDSVTSFGEDARGELYVADQGGEIFKLIPAVATATPSTTPTPTSTWTPLPTDTAAATATSTATATATRSPTLTSTATATESATATATHTATASSTATASPTDTPVPPTPTATATDTPAPPTPAATATDTLVPPTPTETFVDVTPTGVVAPPTETPAAPTRTRTPTRPRTPTRTATPTPTSTQPRPPGSCPGDVDGDGHVEASDVVRIGCALFSTAGRPRWNPAADLNHNGIVDPEDLLIALNSLFDPDCR